MRGVVDSSVVPVGSLRLYERNPRRGDVGAIKESLRVNGQYRPLVVNRRTMEVLAGNHTLRAARELGWREVAVSFVDADAELARRIVLVDNRTNDLAGYDSERLLALLGELPGLDGTGYDAGAVDELLLELQAAMSVGEEAEVPAAPAQPRTRVGDLWRLGRHLLLCGDARCGEGYRRLMGASRAELLWTDPPYGVGYEGRTAARLSLANDDGAGLAALLGEAFAAADGALAEGARLYVAHPAGPLSVLFANAFVAQGWLWRQTLVWLKDAFVLGRSDYHYRHEPILYGFKPGAGRLGRGGAGWYGSNGEASVFELERPRASREHPTMKPPGLVEVALRNSSRPGDLVLDPFAGSGSTLVACERLRRRARLIELDPGYCDVVVGRFERLSGARAELVG